MFNIFFIKWLFYLFVKKIVLQVTIPTSLTKHSICFCNLLLYQMSSVSKNATYSPLHFSKAKFLASPRFVNFSDLKYFIL